MILPIFWSDKIKLPERERDSVHKFLQAMAHRICAGHAQYGTPDKDKQYFKRLMTEARAYKKTGNMEHLRNIANYAWLESYAPSNVKFHDDATVDSVTRGKGF